MPLTVKLSDNAIVDEGQAKAWAYINQENLPEGDLLRLLINDASENLEDFLELEIISRGLITEQLDVRRLDVATVWTLQRPILSVNELNSDTVRSFGATTVIPAADYVVDNERGKITYLGEGGSLPTYFAAGLQSVQIEYWSGYKTRADVPRVIASSVLETVAIYYYHLSRKQFGVNSISDEQGNRTYMKFDFLPEEVKRNLSSKRRRIYARQGSRRVSVDAGQAAP